MEKKWKERYTTAYREGTRECGGSLVSKGGSEMCFGLGLKGEEAYSRKEQE